MRRAQGPGPKWSAARLRNRRRSIRLMRPGYRRGSATLQFFRGYRHWAEESTATGPFDSFDLLFWGLGEDFFVTHLFYLPQTVFREVGTSVFQAGGPVMPPCHGHSAIPANQAVSPPGSPGPAGDGSFDSTTIFLGLARGDFGRVTVSTPLTSEAVTASALTSEGSLILLEHCP